MQPLQFQRQWYFLLDTLSSGNYCKRVIAFIEAGWQFIDLPCFQEKKSIRPTFSAERIFGGALLAMCSNDFICFYDWAECRLIRRIDVNVKVSNKLSLKGLTQMLHNHLSTSAEVIDCCCWLFRISIGLIVVIWSQLPAIHPSTSSNTM